jgi:multiple sugar transport system ATP-binding protein
LVELSLRGIKKRFKAVDVLHGIDLEIKDKELVVFVGPSGCGKSTLLRMIAGLEDITGGGMYIDGRYVNDDTPAERGIGMVFQSYALYPHMSVYENIAFGMKLAKLPPAEIDKRVMDSARILQLEPLLQRKPKDLSGGQRQRVAIGRAIAREPKLFLFDEPLSNLDAALRVQMRMEIASLHRRLGSTIIYVTHDQVEAMTLAQRIVVLNRGSIEQVGTPLELYDHPANIFVAQFIGSPKMNLFTGANADKFKATTVGVRPEHLEIKPADGAWSGKVIYSENLGSDSFIYVDIGSGEPVIVRQEGKSSYHSGDQLSFGPKGNHFHRFDEAGKPLAH